MFDKDCSKRFTISQEQIEAVRDSLVLIIGQTKILAKWEAPLSLEAEKELERIEHEALKIHQILEDREEEGSKE